ncbi:unnamed protein product [Mycena citricolor]|uniref:Cyclin N-terminal domain-containing protein n=1 Tax=Mycena citricolor TaxID=2018698 RepID=A0AAD2H114_9AGAR|nr:unnamed protein product [Mycena citricolor]
MSPTVDYSSWSPASTSSESNSGSPVHPASLVDPMSHSSAILQLVDVQLTSSVIDYIVECIADAVWHGLTRDLHHPSHIAPRTASLPIDEFTPFVRSVLSLAEVRPATVFVALAYVARARRHLAIISPAWALERIFLGALIAASKYTQDSTLRNGQWARCSGVFGRRDVGRIEREFLEVLDWDLGVREEEILVHWGAVMGLQDLELASVDASRIGIQSA